MRSLAVTCLALALALAACAGGHRTHAEKQTQPTGKQVSGRTISSSRLILGGRVRCTATATTPVQAGDDTRVRFSLRNVSAGPVKAPIGDVWLTVRTRDGTTYDTRAAAQAEGSLGGPQRAPITIPAGATVAMASPQVAVRWSGPLRVTPGCGRAALPTLKLQVTAAGPPPDEQAAVGDVVKAAGGLLDRCRPKQTGVAVQGQIDAPDGSAPPLDATCSVSIRRDGRFLVAQALVLIPTNMRGVRVRQPYEDLSLPKRARPYEAIAWEFVVTKDGATTVAGSMRDATRPANRMAPGWDWTGSRWNGPSTSRCGFEGLSGGPSIDFIDVCPS